MRRPSPKQASSELRFALPEDVCAVAGELGRGGFGSVNRATLLRDGRDCALKVVSKRSALGADMARREACALRRLRHSRIVELLDAFEDDNNVYLVLEFIEGQDLCEALQAEQGSLPECAARRLMSQLLRALAACHDAGFVHRDLKPENLMLRGNLHTGNLTLIDFGLAVECAPGRMVRADVAGTCGFLSPEGEHGKYSSASDIFACGKLLERLLPDPSPAAADLSAALLGKDAEQRPSAAEALRHPWLREASSQTRAGSPSKDTQEQRFEFRPSLRTPDACGSEGRKEAASSSSTHGSLGEHSACTSFSTASRSRVSEIDAREVSG